MPNALIVYATRGGNTRKIAEIIAEGIRLTGADADIMNANTVKKEDIFEGYDAYVFGSATYHGEMMQSMKTLLFLAEKASLSEKIGSSFGAYGWSGEASYRIFETMENIFNMNMVSGPLRLKSSGLGGAKEMAQDYGREIGGKMEG